MPHYLLIANSPFFRFAPVAVPWFAALVAAVYRRHVRIIGFSAALISAVISALTIGVVPPTQSLYPALMLLFSCLCLGAIVLLPLRDCTAAMICGILIILGSTLLAYSADNLLVLLIAWVLSSVPFLHPRWFQ